MIRILFNLF